MDTPQDELLAIADRQAALASAYDEVEAVLGVIEKAAAKAQEAGLVIGTMWSVTDDCSHMFTERFYRSLVTPTAAPVVFCTSLQQLISDRSAMGADFANVPMDHPIYWAGFAPVLGA